MSDGGKRSNPRPFSVTQDVYAKNFDAIFRKRTPQELDDEAAEKEAFDKIPQVGETVSRRTHNP